MEKNEKTSSKSLFQSSLYELKSTQTIVFCGLMGAIAAVLNLLTALKVGPYIVISLSWIPGRIVDFMFGPAVGTLFGAVMDIVKHFLKPMGAFDFRFTLVPMLAGLFYGYMFYKKPIRIWRIFVAKLVVTIFLNLGLNTYLIATTMGKGYLAIMPPRIIKNLVALPIETAMMFFVLTTVSAVLKKIKR